MTLRLYTLVVCTAIGLSGLRALARPGSRGPHGRAAPAASADPFPGLQVPQHRPRHDGRPHRRSRGPRIESGRVLRRHRHRRVVEDHQQRHHVGRALRRSRRRRVDRRHRHQPERRQHGVGRQRREQQPPERLVGQRRLQVHRRRPDLEAHGPRRPRSTSRASSSIPSITTWSTWRRSAACGAAAASAASTRRPTAA